MSGRERFNNGTELGVDDKLNVCPICERGFETVAGLRQHWSKKHSQDEINAIIENRSQQIFQQNTTHSDGVVLKKFQIMKDDIITSSGISYHIFDIVENEGLGDCLFLAILEFLKIHKDSFPNTPNSVHDLRTVTVNHVLKSNAGDTQSNFERFRTDLTINLKNEIPSLASKSAPPDTVQSDYAHYMSSPHKYGTTVCAMAEIFKFGFCLIRKIDDENYACYDYGSISKTPGQQTTTVVHLLFTGNVSTGHFRLLVPRDTPFDPFISTGPYRLIKECTSSRMTSIAPMNFSGFNDCVTNEETHTNDTPVPDSIDVSFDDFIILLARCKSNIRVLKRVPRGARKLAANKLSECIEECLASPNLAKNWKNLLTFAYTSLRVPDRVNNVSLSTLVKRNITKAKLVFRKRTAKKKPISLSKEGKIAEGNIRGAVKILTSTDTLAPQDIETLEQLKLKHPPPSREMSFPGPPDKNIEPSNLKDLTLPSTGEAGLRLLKAITVFSNFMFSGKVQSKFIGIMYGASLCALDKKGGGIRPIAVGKTFRRVTSKLASTSVRSEMSSKFAPRQVGYGIKGGCEAAAHATRSFIKKNSHRKVVIVKIDFRNAFNEIDRDVFLNEIKLNCPKIFPYLWQCYSLPTLLFYGDFIILSQNGAQQGDPCGPLIFSSAIRCVIESLISEFVVFYLDDGTIAGEYDSVLRDFNTLKEECAKIGLQIHPTKCELFFCSEIDHDVAKAFDQLSPGIYIVNDFTLLGTPITDSAFDKIFHDKLNELKLLFDRLLELDNYHIAFYILKNCFAVPKLVFLLRTTSTWNHTNVIEEIDNQIRSTLETLTNSQLEGVTWNLASLPPINAGGIGVRRVRDIALPAFLSSVNAVSPLVSTMLNLPTLNIEEFADYEDGLNEWNRTNPNTTQPEKPELQWNSITVNRLLNNLQFERDDDKGRFLALQRSESGAWLHALPSKSIGTLLENNAHLE